MKTATHFLSRAFRRRTPGEAVAPTVAIVVPEGASPVPVLACTAAAGERAEVFTPADPLPAGASRVLRVEAPDGSLARAGQQRWLLPRDEHRLVNWLHHDLLDELTPARPGTVLLVAHSPDDTAWPAATWGLAGILDSPLIDARPDDSLSERLTQSPGAVPGLGWNDLRSVLKDHDESVHPVVLTRALPVADGVSWMSVRAVSDGETHLDDDAAAGRLVRRLATRHRWVVVDGGTSEQLTRIQQHVCPIATPSAVRVHTVLLDDALVPRALKRATLSTAGLKKLRSRYTPARRETLLDGLLGRNS